MNTIKSLKKNGFHIYKLHDVRKENHISISYTKMKKRAENKLIKITLKSKNTSVYGINFVNINP